ncbi:MAG: hypothetical protein ACK5KU_09480, partial [Beutenbergiaceae bacterium]
PAPEGLIVCDGGLRQLARVSVFERAESSTRQEELRAELLDATAPLGRRRHVRRARAVLTHANGFSQSPGQSRVRWLGLSAGLPEPMVQWEVHCDGHQYFTDLAWLNVAGETVTAEFDGAIKYDSGSDAVIAEKVREDRIRATGTSVV